MHIRLDVSRSGYVTDNASDQIKHKKIQKATVFLDYKGHCLLLQFIKTKSKFACFEM